MKTCEICNSNMKITATHPTDPQYDIFNCENCGNTSKRYENTEYENKPAKEIPVKTKSIHGGIQKVFRFPNNYGASVVRHSFSYGVSQGLWELAVIHFDSESDDDFDMDYETGITSDVMGGLTEKKVEETLNRIRNLKRYNKRTVKDMNFDSLRPWKVINGDTIEDSAMSFEAALHFAVIQAGFSSQLEPEKEMELYTDGELYPYNVIYQKPVTMEA